MRRNLFLLLPAVLLVLPFSMSCDKDSLAKNEKKAEIVIKSATASKTEVIPIGTAFTYSFKWTINPEPVYHEGDGTWSRLLFYKEELVSLPETGEAAHCLAVIESFRDADIAYTNLGLTINRITIFNADSLGFGETIDIPMNQGKYEGGNDQITSVIIKSFDYSPNINVEITTKTGDKIIILYLKGSFIHLDVDYPF